MAIKTDTIKITSKNGTFDGYLATPENGPSPGVIVIQEVFGVNDHIKDVTRRVAELGYAALAPDMFWPLQPNFDVGYEGAPRNRVQLPGSGLLPKYRHNFGRRQVPSSLYR